jgi:hypothetical protein
MSSLQNKVCRIGLADRKSGAMARRSDASHGGNAGALRLMHRSDIDA